MSATRKRVEKLAEMLDEVIVLGWSRASEIESVYNVFHAEREYLNVELNIEIDDVVDATLEELGEGDE